MTTPRIDIIGAGIGGLTTAIALERKGIECRIFEQAAELKPVGAGILLGINAMQVFDRLGLAADIEAHGNHITAMTIATAERSVLSKLDLGSFESAYGAHTIAIHRGALQQLLLEKLTSTPLALGHRLERIDRAGARSELVFDNGTVVESSATIGADGIHSAVRTNLFPNSALRDAHQMCWRGVADYSLEHQNQKELLEMWGDSTRFGLVQISADQVYWFAIAGPEGEANDPTSALQALKEIFRAFDPLVGEVLDATTASHVIRGDIEDLRPLPRWHLGTVGLIGDAAHAATPNLGQGACQAIEDAYALAECLARHDLERAFSDYETLRGPKARRVVKYSWQLGQLALVSNPVLRRIRNQVVKATPRSVNEYRLDQILKLAPV